MEALKEAYINYFTITKADCTLLMDYTHVLPWTAVSLYIVLVFIVPRLLVPYAKTKAYQSFVKNVVERLMIGWNLFLSALSLVMLLGVTVPYLATHLTYYDYSLTSLLCDNERRVITGVPSTMITFAWWFGLSKYFELLDTVFLILKNPSRPVPFLHWFHHLTVLLFSWYAAFYNYTAAPPFIIMNAFIHTLMYFYYALTGWGYKPSWGIFLTVGQILQMVGGIIFNVMFFVIHVNTPGGCGCDNPTVIFVASVLMYGSYLYLFCQFFYKRYVAPKKPTDAGETKKAKKEQ